MGLNDNATFKPTTGHYYFNKTVGAAVPADLLDVAGTTGWDEIGHTSMEDLLSITSEGGEVTVLGTLQNKNLRTSRAPRTETMNFTLQQLDANGLKFYYGLNAVPVTSDPRFLAVPTDPTPTVGSFLVVFEDGEAAFAFWAEKAEILRADDLDLADTESLLGLPLSVKPLNNGTNKHAYAVTPVVDVAA